MLMGVLLQLQYNGVMVPQVLLSPGGGGGGEGGPMGIQVTTSLSVNKSYSMGLATLMLGLRTCYDYRLSLSLHR